MATVVGTDPSVQKRCTCRHCASIIEYTLADTREATERDYTGDSDIVRRLTCPKCGTEITVSRR